MVLIGGLTRLTDSGLSITDWSPIMGMFPPMSYLDWLSLFNKYKETSEGGLAVQVSVNQPEC